MRKGSYSEELVKHQEVSGHEREQHQTSDSQIQLATHQSRRQLLISSPLQTREDVLQRTQQPIFLDDVLLESKACTVQTNVEITVPVEVVWLATLMSMNFSAFKSCQHVFLRDCTNLHTTLLLRNACIQHGGLRSTSCERWWDQIRRILLSRSIPAGM